MEKYDNIVKSAEIRKLVEHEMFEKALLIVDTMEVNKIKVLTDLSVFADVYTQTGRYQEAKKILLRIREKTNSRRVIYQLIKLSIRMNNVEASEEYYEEYIKAAPRDSDKYILRYRIDKMKNEELSVLIETLEALKEQDYVEKWAYELAKLYHRAGFKDKCVRECSDIILWFGEGIIVEKAKLLKEHYVGSPDRINAIRAVERKAIEEEKGLTKTKDLALVTDEIKSILEDELKAFVKTEKADPEEANQEEVDPEEANREEANREEANREEANREEANLEEPEIEEVIIEEREQIEDGITYNVKDVDERCLALCQNDDVQGILKNYLTISKLNYSICSSLQKILDNDETRLFLVTGYEHSGKTTLSTMLAGVLYKLGHISTSQVAKINATQLNQICILDRKDRLQHGAVIIEKAGMLEENIIKQIFELLKQLGKNIIIFLEDEPEEMKKLLEENSQMRAVSYFDICVPIYDKRDLLGLAVDFFEKAEYYLEAEAAGSLDKMIEDIIKDQNENQQTGIMFDQLQRVKQKADKRNMEALVEVVKTGNYQQSGLNKLASSDFVVD